MPRPSGGLPGTLGVLAQRELDARHRTFEDHPLRILAPAHLQHDGLAADRVGRAVQDVGGGHSAGQRAVDGDVLRVDHVLDVHHRRDRHAALIDVAVHRDVRVAVDDARYYVLAGRVDDGGVLRHHHLLADFGDLPVFDHHRPLQRALGHRHDGGVLDDDVLGAQRRHGGQRQYPGFSHWFTSGPSAAPRPPPAGNSGAGLYCLPSTKIISIWV